MARRKSVAVRRRRYAKRRYNRKRRSSSRTIAKLSYRNAPFPREYVTKITYGDTRNIVITAGVPTPWVYAMNGLYDPDITGVGGQARYFDSLCGANDSTAPYRAYVVFASKIQLMFFPSGSAPDSMGMRSLVSLTAGPSTITQPTTIQEMIMRTSDTKSAWVNYWFAPNAKSNITWYRKIAPILGVNKLSDATGCNAAYNSNPTNLAYWFITAYPVAGGTTTTTIQFIAKITYYVKFYSLNDVLDS